MQKTKDILITCLILGACYLLLKSGGTGPVDLSPAEAAHVQSLVNQSSAQASSEEPVVVFMTSWCGTCRYLERKLKDEGIPFLAFDVEKNIAAQAVYRRFNQNAVPVSVVKNKLIIGAQLDEIRKARGEHT